MKKKREDHFLCLFQVIIESLPLILWCLSSENLLNTSIAEFTHSYPSSLKQYYSASRDGVIQDSEMMSDWLKQRYSMPKTQLGASKSSLICWAHLVQNATWNRQLKVHLTSKSILILLPRIHTSKCYHPFFASNFI